MVDVSRHIDLLGPSGKTLSVSERSGLQVGLQPCWIPGFFHAFLAHFFNTCFEKAVSRDRYTTDARLLPPICSSSVLEGLDGVILELIASNTILYQNYQVHLHIV